jgi:hypothetical protein
MTTCRGKAQQCHQVSRQKSIRIWMWKWKVGTRSNPRVSGNSNSPAPACTHIDGVRPTVSCVPKRTTLEQVRGRSACFRSHNGSQQLGTRADWGGVVLHQCGPRNRSPSTHTSGTTVCTWTRRRCRDYAVLFGVHGQAAACASMGAPARHGCAEWVGQQAQPAGLHSVRSNVDPPSPRCPTPIHTHLATQARFIIRLLSHRPHVADTHPQMDTGGTIRSPKGSGLTVPVPPHPCKMVTSLAFCFNLRSAIFLTGLFYGIHLFPVSPVLD